VTQKGWGGFRWALVGLLLLAWALRLPPLLRSPLHPDEALYGYWGLLIGQGRDAWLTSVPVYKPPLLPYSVAGSQLLVGDETAALRLPGLVAGLATVPLVGALAHALYEDRWAGTMAATSVALSPFAVVFSGTAFPDPLMVALGLAACLAAVNDRPRWAGLLAGLSFAAKQTGLVWLPLLILIRIFRLDSHGAGRQFPLSLVGYWILVVGLAFGWDAARVSQGASSFWQVGVVGYGGLRLIWPQELWPRLGDWVRLMRHLFASPVINGLLLVGLPILVAIGIVRHPGARGYLADILLASFLLIYFLFHWLVALPIWDRYLLPLVPILAVLLGRLGRGVASRLSFLSGSWRTVVVGLLLAVFLSVPAFQASANRYPIGQERAAYEGIEGIVSFFGELPEGSVVYHHWLGWHYHYTLWDAPIYLAYWPNPAWLVRDVEVFGGREPRYIAFPAWESSARVEHRLNAVGYALDPVMTAVRSDGSLSLTVYQLSSSPD
jgi:4-amino-4-deoxy-L-arabinose transferase-like glycosyltransferase